jgi:dynein heavy chain, axonemal
VQDRRKFGAIGWNIAYEFTNEDLMVCKKQLRMLLDEYEEIPYKVLNFLGAEINYGGRVTDDKDVRLITTIIKVYLNA